MPNDRSFFNTAKGYFGSWGRQNNIVQEIGQGAIFPIDMASLRSTDSERHIVLQTTSGNELTYYTVGDWRRGRTFPVAPIVTDWENEMKALTARLHNPARVTIGRRERFAASSSIPEQPIPNRRARPN